MSAAPAGHDDRRATPHLSLVLPMRDEAPSVRPLLAELDAVMSAAPPLDWEALAVDDGSRDATLRELAEERAARPWLRVLSQPAAGKSTAIAAGFRAARGELLAVMDADLQYDPRDLRRMAEALDADAGAACAVGRRARREDALARRLQSRLANSVARLLLRGAQRDGGCGLFVMRRGALPESDWFDGMHRLWAALIARRGGRALELDITHRPRRFGASRYGSGVGRGPRTLLDALGARAGVRRRALAQLACEIG